MRRLLLLLAALIAAMAAFASRGQVTQADEPLVVSPDVMADFALYKSRTKPLYFAVSSDGLFSWYTYCIDYNCQAAQGYRREVIKDCEEEGGTDCVIFAVGDEVQVEFRVGDPATMVAAPATRCAIDTLVSNTAVSAIVAPLRPGVCSSFRRFGYLDDFKAFAASDPAKFRSARGWGSRYASPEEAMKIAMEQCAKSQKELSISEPCELFVIGDIVVRGMSEAERRAAAEVNRKNKDATNVDLPPPG